MLTGWGGASHVRRRRVANIMQVAGVVLET
jgi:hypothetical protein